MRGPGPLPRAVAALAVLVAGLTGCAGSAEDHAPIGLTTAAASSSPVPAAPPPEQPVPEAEPEYATAVSATSASIEVRDAPAGAVVHTMPNPRESGAPLTFLLDLDPGGEWLRVLLPVRPNGATGWVSRDDVALTSVEHRLEMSTADNTLALYVQDELVDTFEAASGTGDTPTPLGTFYLVELLRPTNAGYGPYAYGLSGFSEVLNDFGGGPGQIGLHGTDDPSSIGRAASHGCIRLSDEDITRLAQTLPLGTPIVIT